MISFLTKHSVMKIDVFLTFSAARKGTLPLSVILAACSLIFTTTIQRTDRNFHEKYRLD